MECGRNAEEVRPSRRAEGSREVFGVALEEGFGDDVVAADDGVGVAVGAVVDRWVERVGDVVLAAVNGGVGKETVITFWRKVSSVKTKGEVKNNPSSTLWPITSFRDLSY